MLRLTCDAPPWLLPDAVMLAVVAPVSLAVAASPEAVAGGSGGAA